ncbi:MAG TPA: hypothetical protein VFE90_11150 [Myxococcales bacterium]|nr:hypothetical protein [Myxococcales bacterium]
MTHTTLLAMLVLVSAAVRAEEVKPADAAAPAAKAEATPAAPEAKPAAMEPAAAKPAEARPHVDAALTFLKGLTHTSRPGEEGDMAWEAARTNAAQSVTMKVAGKDIVLDLAGHKSDARLVRFQKVSTLRDGAAVKGVTLENVEMKIGADAHSGKATVRMEEKDGKWLVTALEVE